MSSAGNTSADTSGNLAHPPFLAFTNDSASLAVLRQFAQAHSFSPDCIQQGDITTAVEFLKSHPSPQVLCVDVASVEAAPPALDKLADVCHPGIKVIVSGTVNEYSFYCWLMEVGVSSYLLNPLTGGAIETAYRKATEAPAVVVPVVEAKKDGKIISVIGSRGGAGASTVCVNLAWILANHLHQKTLIMDFDPQLGTAALSLDIEPSRGLRDALEKPDRIDGLFMDRVMVKLDDYLSVLSAEEGLDEQITPSEAAAEALFNQMRPRQAFIVVDIPRVLTPFTRYALAHSDAVICVTEYTLTALRECVRYLEFCRDKLKIKPPLFVANRVGLAGKYQMPIEEFEKGLGAKVAYSIPFAPEAYGASVAGELWVEMAKNTPAVKSLHALAEHFHPDTRKKKDPPKGLLSFIKGGK